ncbi:hypothetical protein [Neolewinella antarctica]|uniref:Uncharacterized protein n=1 Tax=Neolewinella antarctica TaxID=442734 RepID=A0ABX0XDK0_9BACT|nr:hypothetical protein [Neolewinella antarctica]NJC27370.1 hypothetical protein [Neolewinella antarctica]
MPATSADSNYPAELIAKRYVVNVHRAAFRPNLTKQPKTLNA